MDLSLLNIFPLPVGIMLNFVNRGCWSDASKRKSFSSCHQCLLGKLLQHRYLLQCPAPTVHSAFPGPRVCNVGFFSGNRLLQCMEILQYQSSTHQHFLQCPFLWCMVTGSTHQPATSPINSLEYFCTGVPLMRHFPVNSFPKHPRRKFLESSTGMEPQCFLFHSMNQVCTLSKKIDLVAKITHAFLASVKSMRASGKTMLVYQGG